MVQNGDLVMQERFTMNVIPKKTKIVKLLWIQISSKEIVRVTKVVPSATFTRISLQCTMVSQMVAEFYQLERFKLVFKTLTLSKITKQLTLQTVHHTLAFISTAFHKMGMNTRLMGILRFHWPLDKQLFSRLRFMT